MTAANCPIGPWGSPRSSVSGHVLPRYGLVALVCLGLCLIAGASRSEGQPQPEVTTTATTEHAGGPARSAENTKPLTRARLRAAKVVHPGDQDKGDPDPVEQKWGVRVLGLRLTAGGYMMDFRYCVKNPEKAKPLFEKKAHAVLIQQETGAKFAVPSPPKLGRLRNTDIPVKNRVYAALFANPGQYVKRGDKVTIDVGDFHVEDLIVK